MAISTPSLNISESGSTVSVSVIDSTSKTIAKTGFVVQPHIQGHDEFNCPCYLFLITHPAIGRKVLFNLGIRKDPENLAPRTYPFTGAMTISSERNVANILGKDASTITDISYPAREESWILERDYAGRQYNAFDYFGDGSFYLLDCPGHTIAHMMGLARTRPTSFVLMAADCCHHGGEIRPTQFVPLPDSIELNSPRNLARGVRRAPCPGQLFVHLHLKSSRTEPFYELINPHDLGHSPGGYEKSAKA
ncbi:n-acyl homoserine lactonase [Fusarium beomiforme]|uniref:N-acyl homoserine lactonase n=1 Tax=Fusarium beomiforme TaxID=44412 RepID=A0A9P5A4T4_9HYPO|nr:n-acyl homoserine lactonase [Fusarium beomiforme]